MECLVGAHNLFNYDPHNSRDKFIDCAGFTTAPATSFGVDQMGLAHCLNKWQLSFHTTVFKDGTATERRFDCALALAESYRFGQQHLQRIIATEFDARRRAPPLVQH